MGVTLESKNFSIDMGYIGFNRLRTKVAHLVEKELGEHYEALDRDVPFMKEEERKQFFVGYNKKIAEIQEKFKIPDAVLEFLYAPDSDGKITYGRCKKIYEVIKDYDDNIAYGYCGRSDCAMFKDFKNIVKDCIENKCSMKWF